MSLIKCVECGKKISKDAAACPKCGAPAAKSVAAAAKPKEAGPVATGLAFGTIGLVVLFMVNSCREDEARAARHAQELQAEAKAVAAAPAKASPPAKPAAPKVGLRKFSQVPGVTGAWGQVFLCAFRKQYASIHGKSSSFPWLASTLAFDASSCAMQVASSRMSSQALNAATRASIRR